ncbi:MAG: CYTH domain-containing protein [Spirochaetaceae bacterium]|nr:CYTH domain-containing protein [Spirochaetaceae bacterium]MDT8298532.1 CYTH domain-containing protein [Spirochaetaceae bacterium]
MATEIERKFLVDAQRLPSLPTGLQMKQGYIRTESFTSVRARIKGPQGFLTVKGPSSEDGLSRLEYEYPIPLDDAHSIIDNLCDGGIVEKTRYEIPFGGWNWEVDFFTGANSGLIIAEVELTASDSKIQIPDWAVQEVTGDIRYYNLRLAEFPWSEWRGPKF